MLARKTLRLAGELFASGRFREAETLYRQVANHDPNDLTVASQLGRLSLFGNQLEETKTWLKVALAQQPKSVSLRAQLADALYRQRAFLDAASHYQAAGRLAMAEKLHALSPREPYGLEATAGDCTVIPWLAGEPLPVICAGVNGEEANLVLDTGVGELALDPEFARRASVQLGGSEVASFAGGTQSEIRHGWLESLTLGDFRLEQVPAQVYDTEHLFAPFFPGLPIHGVLGTAVFYRFLSTLDYPGSRLVLRRQPIEAAAQPADNRLTVCSIPFWLAGDHYVVTHARLNGAHPILLCVDTGMTGAALAAPLATVRTIGARIGQKPPDTGYGGAGTVQTLPFELSELSLDGVTQRHVAGRLLPSFPLERNLGFRIGGLLAHDFFRPYALTLDFDRMRLCLREADSPPHPRP